ncbi:MAG TPA: hypothetical protein VGM60_20705 [Pseudonocardia sp.]|jgi:hypothetical protein|uniref:hypothetical protein n=1 Tax=Pseudonocardia sp. TaxID=60912 RepID=UPI002F3ED729
MESQVSEPGSNDPGQLRGVQTGQPVRLNGVRFALGEGFLGDTDRAVEGVDLTARAWALLSGSQVVAAASVSGGRIGI